MLSQIQTHLESIYRIEAPSVSEFLIDASQVLEVLGKDVRQADEWVLVREAEDGVDLAVFIAEEHLKMLRQANSLAHAAEIAFPSFCAATEGVSHFLMLVERSRRTEPVSMLELEAQAEVDKFVCATLHHPSRSEEWWRRLFRETSLAEGLDVEEMERYEEAGRLAAAFCGALTEEPHVDAFLRTLRSFWRKSGALRLEHMRRLAA
ncbi:MAG: hypothetical protein CL930_00970 [Deltaproteobacteria bacterium]|nr:hypothetical protein [Deltaproteobacteria bacterium]